MDGIDKQRELGKQKLYGDISSLSGVAEEEVRKVLEVLGIDHHIDEVTKYLGAVPTLNEVFLGYHISPSTVTV